MVASLPHALCAPRCEDGEVVCKAALRDGNLETVGDLVCETRGTPKPTWDANPERMAADCTVLPTLRDDQPTEQCMAKSPRPSPAPGKGGIVLRLPGAKCSMCKRRKEAAEV